MCLCVPAHMAESKMLATHHCLVRVQEPLSLHATAETFVRPALRRRFLDLCARPASEYLARFPFQSDLVKAMFATTDGFSGLCGGWDTPGTGLNFLGHNMCRLGGADGTWMVVQGGMGSVTQALARRAAEAGAEVETGAAVRGIVTGPDGAATGVRVATGGANVAEREIAARAVLVNADPWRLRALLPDAVVPAGLDATLRALRKYGMTMKVGCCWIACAVDAKGVAHVHLSRGMCNACIWAAVTRLPAICEAELSSSGALWHRTAPLACRSISR
jgi:phytoene dehydrogenase-like protein